MILPICCPTPFSVGTHVIAGLYFDLVAGREECVEADDKRRVAAEQAGHPRDDARSIDTVGTATHAPGSDSRQGGLGGRSTGNVTGPLRRLARLK